MFAIPPSPFHSDGRESVYLCGNSLGCMPHKARQAVIDELDDWALLGVEGHFKARHDWYRAHEALREPLGRLVGAHPHEVVAMNSLSVNLHLLMASFYRPVGERRAILIDGPCFPSDVYAVKSQLRFQGVPESDGLIWARPRPGEHTLRTEDVVTLIEHNAPRLALVMMAGVNYVTGQWHDMRAITAAGRHAGAMVGWDLAHAAGNVPLALHDWDADFAVWCSYKYLNSGPGAVAGAFVHERHTRGVDERTRADMPRFEGWWGNDPDTRFEMGERFVPVASADAWQLSNPPILALAPLRASLGIFDDVGMPELRRRSLELTGALESRLRALSGDRFEIITPSEPERRGCQLSIRVRGDAPATLEKLHRAGVICDFRRPDVIRVAPAPLYNTLDDADRFVEALRGA